MKVLRLILPSERWLEIFSFWFLRFKIFFKNFLKVTRGILWIYGCLSTWWWWLPIFSTKTYGDIRWTLLANSGRFWSSDVWNQLIISFVSSVVARDPFLNTSCHPFKKWVDPTAAPKHRTSSCKWFEAVLWSSILSSWAVLRLPIFQSTFDFVRN